MNRIRFPAVAGMFYPKDTSLLDDEVGRYLVEARNGSDESASSWPKIIVVPHAGYRYSAGVAAAAYRLVESMNPAPRKVVLLGPSHTVAFSGMAISQADTWRTPLGDVALDRDTIERLLALPQVTIDDTPHIREHALEVQIPFLQRVLPAGFSLVPIVVGRCEPEPIADLLDACWGGPETLVVVSTDLSHYHPLPDAKALDSSTLSSILSLDVDALTTDRACGAIPLRGAMVAAKRHHLTPEFLASATSADGGGDHWRVVGYGSLAFEGTT